MRGVVQRTSQRNLLYRPSKTCEIKEQLVSLSVEEVAFHIVSWIKDYATLKIQRKDFLITCCHPDMELIDFLGCGSFGVAVLRQNRKTSEQVVDKIISTTNANEEAWVQEEVEFLEEVKECPEVIRLLSYNKCTEMYDPPNMDHHIVTEYFPGETLETFLYERYLSIPERRKVLFQLGQGLQQLHSKNIIHGDLTAKNIIINDDLKVKIIDFGCACWGPESNRYVGSQYTGAPEAFATTKHNPAGEPRTFSFPSDYYQLGSIAYRLEYRCCPIMFMYKCVFTKLSQEMKQYVLHMVNITNKMEKALPLPIVVKFPYESEKLYQNLMERLLDPDPKRRLQNKTFQEHPFFTLTHDSVPGGASTSVFDQCVKPLTHLAVDTLVQSNGQELSKRIKAVTEAKKRNEPSPKSEFSDEPADTKGTNEFIEAAIFLESSSEEVNL